MMHAALVLAQQAAPASDDVYLLVSLGLLALAIVLLVLDLFIPTAGVLAILTGVAAVASIASMFVYDATWGGIYLVIVCAGSPLAVILAFKVWSKTPIANRMVLKGGADGAAESHGRGADEAATDLSRATHGVAARATAAQLAAFVGKHGVAATTLRPVGFVRVEGARLDAVAESGFIEAGRAVRVLEALEGQLKVREEPARSD